jgi:uncharacterized protein YjbI with pentapeptide repeats
MVDHPPQPAEDDNAKAQRRRRVIWSLVGAGLVVLGLLLACVLWIPRSLYPSLTETDLRGVSDAAKVQELKGARLKLQNDARTTLLQGLGAVLVLAGATGGVWATLRQVRASHDQLKLGEQGQVTDRYTRAVEQLGHEKAPVRLGALYSLERLAQDNIEYRQTVADVVCAYLRMPYTPPARSDPDATHLDQAVALAVDEIPAGHPVPGKDPAQEEFQVRQTAQRLLADHLRRPPGISSQDAQLLAPSPQQAFWPGISLDLTGATLVDFNFAQVSVIQAQFAGVTFHGSARFGKATFQRRAWFDGATFQHHANFAEATFQITAGFGGATFQGDARFAEATIQDNADFRRATFQGYARFGGATFQGDARFAEATIQDNADFDRATFQGEARFDGATFRRAAGFEVKSFQGDAMFGGATFQGDARFGNVTFRHTVRFGGATFQGDARFAEATFRGDADFAKATIQGAADFAGATIQGAARFAEASFQGAADFRRATFQHHADFRRATFPYHANFAEAHVLHLDNPNGFRVWPDGWTVLPEPTDPSRGTLVRAEPMKEPEPTAPRPTTPEDG